MKKSIVDRRFFVLFLCSSLCGTHELTLTSFLSSTYIDTYRDYSQVDLAELYDAADNIPKANPDLFPAKLYRILQMPEYANIIAWQPHGRTWAILDKQLLVSIVLPVHFNHSNYESFNRSMNGWGFKVGLFVWAVHAKGLFEIVSCNTTYALNTYLTYIFHACFLL